jgi:hypothetical protein
MMMGLRTAIGPDKRQFGDVRPRAARIAAVLAGLLILAGAAVTLAAADAANAQNAPQPLAPPDASAGTAPPPPEPDSSYQPGFLDALGRWIGDSTSKIGEGIKNTGDAIGGIGEQATGVAKDAAGAAGRATGTIVGLPGTRVVNGRERCAVAANGAPDCAPAANALCRSKGFTGGRGTAINSAQKCPAWVYWSGRGPNPTDCVPETFVLGAVCQ